MQKILMWLKNIIIKLAVYSALLAANTVLFYVMVIFLGQAWFMLVGIGIYLILGFSFLSSFGVEEIIDEDDAPPEFFSERNTGYGSARIWGHHKKNSYEPNDPFYFYED